MLNLVDNEWWWMPRQELLTVVFGLIRYRRQVEADVLMVQKRSFEERSLTSLAAPGEQQGWSLGMQVPEWTVNFSFKPNSWVLFNWIDESSRSVLRDILGQGSSSLRESRRDWMGRQRCSG